MKAASLTTDTASFRKGVNALAAQYGVEVKTVMLRQVSIIGGQLIKAFPPKNAKIGKQAIQNDLNRIILTAGAGKDAAITPVGKVKTYADGAAVITTDKGVLFVESGSASGAAYKGNDPQSIAPYHNELRDKRTGRTRNRGPWTVKKGNRIAIQNRLIVTPAALKKYIQSQSLRVGNLASGWMATLNIYRGPGKGKAAAAFVSRHGESNGSVIDGMSRDGSGSIVFKNQTPYASRWKRQNDFVLRNREKGMVKELKAAINAAAKKTQGVK
jgi:hypothetical protein